MLGLMEPFIVLYIPIFLHVLVVTAMNQSQFTLKKKNQTGLSAAVPKK